jgi:catechol 1,2-dioxygenase
MQSATSTVQSTSPYFDEARSAEVVNARMSEDADARLRQVMTVLVKHLHAAVKEIEPTHEEWFTAIRFLTETGQMCTDWRQEYILLSDILGVSMLVDAINHRRPSGATPNTILGPFYIANAPAYPNGANICLDGKGEPMIVEGRVTDIKGNPIPNAKLPGLTRLEVGLDVSAVDYACDVVLYTEFESQESLDAYASHPEHLRVKQIVGDIRIARHQVDYI